jgi:hypothetical protein
MAMNNHGLHDTFNGTISHVTNIGNATGGHTSHARPVLPDMSAIL